MMHLDGLGDMLVREAEGTNKRVLLAAPFVKRAVVERLFDVISPTVVVHLVTRWNVHDVVAGASDPDVWELVRTRDDTKMKLVSNLHAKYYRFDDRCFIGSANLTQKALGWTRPANVEVLVSRPVEGESAVETALHSGIEVTDEVYRRFLRQGEESEVEHLIRDDGVDSSESEAAHVSEPSIRYDTSAWWTPSMRQPSQLYDVYAGNLDSVTRAGRAQAQEDLQHFKLPPGMSRSSFEAEVAWQLYQKPIVQDINSFTQTTRRFGAVRDHLKNLLCSTRPDFDASRAWQTLIRWLLHFMPDEYEMHEANYSEIFQHRPK